MGSFAWGAKPFAKFTQGVVSPPMLYPNGRDAKVIKTTNSKAELEEKETRGENIYPNHKSLVEVERSTHHKGQDPQQYPHISNHANDML